MANDQWRWVSFSTLAYFPNNQYQGPEHLKPTLVLLGITYS